MTELIDTPREVAFAPESTNPDERHVRRRRTTLTWLSFPLLSGLLGYCAYFLMFSIPHDWLPSLPYDDEGYWLEALRSYHEHGGLYNHTYSQCGPFYNEAWSLVFSLSRLPIDTNSAHVLTLGMWVLTSLLFGVAVAMLSRRVLLGLVGEAVSFLLLVGLANEAMEPAGLAYLLVGVTLVGLAYFVRGRRRLGAGIAGIAVSALVFTKVNVGVFVLAGLVFALLIYWPSPRWPITRRVVASLGLLLVPVLLMSDIVTEGWVQWYLILELLSLVGVVAVATSTRPLADTAFTTRDVLFGAAAGITTTILIALGVLINGTSLSQLVDGALLSQRLLELEFQIAPPITKIDLVFALVATAPAIVIGAQVAASGRMPEWTSTRASGYLRIVVGVWILLTICGAAVSGSNATSVSGLCCTGILLVPRVLTLHLPGQSFVLAAPLAWVAVIGLADDGPRLRFARVALCAMGVVCCLEAFPTAGTQLSWASLSLVPVGALCLSDGLTVTSRLRISGERDRGRARAEPSVSLALAALLVLLLWGMDGPLLNQYRTAYNAAPPTQLEGAGRLHVPTAADSELLDVTRFLKTRCSTYWSLPGLDSFYFFSGEEPPTDLNTSRWMNLFTQKQQDTILQALLRTPRLCLVESENLVSFWDQANGLSRTPLVRYMETDFVVVKKIGLYQLLVRRT